MTKTLSIIVAVAQNNGIGYKNDLLAYLSNDLKRFKKITDGHTVVMGRNTWFSLPNKPLPNRQNIVVTDISGETFEGADAVYSLDEAVDKCPDKLESFIIGGAGIYQQFFERVDRLYITRILKKFEADTFFPEIDSKTWRVESESEIYLDEKSGLNFQYVNFIRQKS